MKKYIIVILLAISFVATPVYAQTSEVVLTQIISLLTQLNELLILQNDLLKGQVRDVTAMNTFLEDRLQICSTPTPTAQIQPTQTPVLDAPPPTRTTHLMCDPVGGCYQVTDEFHY